MRIRSLRWLGVLLFLASCSDDAGPGTECPNGEVLNPVTGVCVPRTTTTPDPNNTTPDGGPADPDASTPTPDAGDPDVGVPDMDLPTTCAGNERRCNGATVEMCVNGMFQVTQTCGPGFVCERANCVPQDAGTCTPGATRCSGTAQFQTCLDDGMTWSDAATCPMNQTCSDGECSAGCAGLLTEKSNVGCEYVSMRHNQASGIRTLPHTVVVSNPGDQPVTVQVSSPAGINPGITPQTVPPLDSVVLNFPTSPMVNTNGISSNIYLIRSSEPVIATQFAPLNNPGIGSETSDASLLLPTNALGMEYVVVGWRALQPGGTYVDIVAVQPDTMVTVQSPVPLSGGAAGNVAQNSSQAFTLQANQVLHLSENRGFLGSGTRDVSGVIVTSNKPVAVYTGATIINIPDEPIRANPPAGCIQTSASCVVNDDCCSGICAYDPQARTYGCADGLSAGDHVEQQLFPVDTWGTSYVATPYVSRGTNDFTIYRVVAAQDGTMVTLDPPVNGVSSFTLNRGQMRQLYGSTPFELSATQPVMLAQFMIGGSTSASGDGDPAFLIPPAVQQYRDSYVFMTPGNYARNFVTLIKEAGVQITLDGAAVPQASFQPVGGASGWEYAIVDNLAAGVHRASAASPFGVVVHGMDNYISYAFAGGIILPD